MPDHVDVPLDIVEADRWPRADCPPIRLTPATPPTSGANRPAPWEIEIRMARPHVGQDRYWVAWARGEVAATIVETGPRETPPNKCTGERDRCAQHRYKSG
eukprot:7425799-Lingulodinium_polyedra.AAC.1